MIVIPTSSFPLTWPVGVPRSTNRKPSPFKKTDVHHAGRELLAEVKRMRPKAVVLSSNMHTNDDGVPYAGATPRGGDPGVAIYWTTEVWRAGKWVLVPYVMPCDKWMRAADNLHALALSVEALRGMDRWGAVTVEQAFSGFAALPAGAGQAYDIGSIKRPWREVLGGFSVELGVDDLLMLAKARHRRLMQTAHPDHGGSTEAAAELNGALAEAEAELAVAGG